MPKHSGKSGIPNQEMQERMQKIRYAEKIRNEADRKYGYSRALMEYQGAYKEALPDFILGVDMIPINEVFAFVKTFIPSVYARDPFIAVNAKGKKWIIGSKILEHATNAYWRELKIKRQVKRAILDAVFAEGYVKVGYSKNISKDDDEKSVNPSQFVENNEIFCQHIHWKMMVRDPDATDGLYDARFVAQKLILPLEAIQDSDLYENTDNLKPSYTMDMILPDYQKLGHEYKAQKKYVVLWEEWDRDENKVRTLAEGHDRYLMEKDWPYQFKKKGSNQPYPYELLRFNEATQEPYAPNLIGPWEPQLWEKIKIRALELDHIKRFGRQYIAERGALNEQEEDKLVKGITGSVIKKEQGRPDPVPMQYPAIQTDIYGVENRIDMDKDNISGQPSVARAAPQKTQSRTVGELSKIMTAFEARQTGPQDDVETFSEEVSKKLIGLMQQYFRGEKFIKITQLDQEWLETELQMGLSRNPNDQDLQDQNQRLDMTGFLMKPKDIKDIEFDVEVRAGSALPLDKKNRMTSMINMLELAEKIGIQPGGKLSKVIGRNLFAEWDMPEIQQAYEEDLKFLEAQIKTGLAAQAAQHRMQGNRIQAMQRRANGMGQPPAPPQQVPL